jgi:glutathione synthase/RimK-type ligase-like ATP-grasp enzyme
MKIAFATCDEYPDLTVDDRLLLPELRKSGISVEPLVWDRADTALDDFDAIILRSCWDYHHKTQNFRRWLEKLEASTVPVFNSPKILKWNLDKSYLREIALRGVEIPRTVWLEAGEETDLTDLLETHKMGEAVVKPMVSMLGLDTWRTSIGMAKHDQEKFQDLLRTKALMVQEYVSEIETVGELSLIFFSGIYSHCVRKIPKPGEFRIHEEHGGTRREFQPDSAIIDQARKVLQAIGSPLLYARVDGVPVGGELQVMEVELIDPTFFLKYSEEASRRFAHALRGLI